MNAIGNPTDHAKDNSVTTSNISVPQMNKFGSMRLMLAFLVIVSHSSELVDGNRSREILTRIFGTLSLGDLAVDGFLGQRILDYEKLYSVQEQLRYLSKRILRIVPGFVVAYLVTLVVIGPLVGRTLASLVGPGAYEALGRMLLMVGPRLDGAFAGLPHQQLNSSMWTIAYEFRCYLFTMALGALGLFVHRRLCLAMTVGLLALLIAKFDIDLPMAVTAVTGRVDQDIRFLAAFYLGGVFFLFGDRIVYTGRAAFFSACLLIALMFTDRFADPAALVFGGYLVFWLCLATRPNALNVVGHRTDVLYGLYLYAWPVQNSLIWFWPGISPLMVLGFATPIAAALGYLSWTLVEQPFLRLKGRNAT